MLTSDLGLGRAADLLCAAKDAEGLSPRTIAWWLRKVKLAPPPRRPSRKPSLKEYLDWRQVVDPEPSSSRSIVSLIGEAIVDALLFREAGSGREAPIAPTALEQPPWESHLGRAAVWCLALVNHQNR